jgi:hypothetical protein
MYTCLFPHLQEFEKRPEIMAAARKEVELKTAAVRLWEDARPWISAEERKEAEDLVGGRAGGMRVPEITTFGRMKPDSVGVGSARGYLQQDTGPHL